MLVNFKINLKKSVRKVFLYFCNLSRVSMESEWKSQLYTFCNIYRNQVKVKRTKYNATILIIYYRICFNRRKTCVHVKEEWKS